MANRLSHVLGPGLKVRQVHLGICRAVCVIQFSLQATCSGIRYI